MVKRRKLGVMTRFMAAFALLFAVFSHQAPAAARTLDPITTQDYTLPNGTIADICFGMEGVSNGDHSTSHEKQVPFCDYCRLASTALLPEPPDEAYLIFAFLQVAERAVFEPAPVDRHHPRPRSRAPPSLV